MAGEQHVASKAVAERGAVAALQRAADFASLVAAWLAGLCVLGLTLLVLIDTAMALISRYVPSFPTGTGIGWEYSAYLMGAAFLLGSGMTLRAGLQLRVELLLSMGKGRYARMFEIFAAILGSVVTLPWRSGLRSSRIAPGAMARFPRTVSRPCGSRSWC
ncbi:TRAP transporter small permease subunit [Paracoccus kondratievae]